MFKIHDKVRLRADSAYAYQSKEEGIIKQIETSRGLSFYVVFSNGYSNNYGLHDLEKLDMDWDS